MFISLAKIFRESLLRLVTGLFLAAMLSACSAGGGGAFIFGGSDGSTSASTLPTATPFPIGATPTPSPGASPTPTPATLTSVGVGGYHACSIYDGGLKCWGDNTEGTLGNDTVTDSDSPVQVTGLGNNTGVTYVPRLGTYFACAIVNGGVMCWGDNDFGESGNGGSSSNSLFPCAGTSNYTFGNGSFANTVPVSVSGMGPGAGVTSLALSTVYSACAVVNGAAMCWGENLDGVLGNGTTQCSTVPVTAVASGATAVAVGSYFSCAVVNTGVKCWGDNTNGQLGNGTTTDSSTPVNVSTLPAGSGITNVVAAENHVCALRDDGAVFCWGNNADGQLGNGTTTNTSTPTLVTGLGANSGVISISAGSNNVCAVESSGAALCWGDNTYGQLGTGNQTASLVPTAVSTLGAGSNTTSITIDFASACAIVNGNTYCWGSNFEGVLGTGNTTNYFTPTLVQGF